VDLGSNQVGSNLDLMAYNTNQAFGFPGGEPNSTGAFGSLLNNTNFSVLRINVVAATSNPITSVPATLANHAYFTAADATVTRSISITNGNPGPNSVPFNFDNASFVLTTINKTVNMNDIEKWTVTNNNVFGHTFHIHDVEFKIVARNGSAAAVGSHESGWKDVMYVPKGESVTFVAKFDDYADAIHPFMYHCHFSNHEDGGMMGQFVVMPTVTKVNPANSTSDFMIYPNPAENRLYLKFPNPEASVYYLRISNSLGKVGFMMPRPELKNGIDISQLSPGVYFVEITDSNTKEKTIKKFIKE
jgi:hypothetical protein